MRFQERATGNGSDLVIHGVDPVWTQQLDSLTNQIGASTVKHAKAQVQVEFVRRSLRVQAFKRAETALWPKRQGETH